MSTKGRNQFSNHHPNKGQREAAETEVAAQKGEISQQSNHKHYHDDFGAPHFPPSENLPPQAKRLAAAKAERAREQAEREAARKAAGTEGQSQAAREAHEPEREEYPNAAPEKRDARAAVGQAWSRVTEQASPVLEDAQEHIGAIRESASKLWSETRELLRTPVVLARVIFSSRGTA